MGRLTLLCFSLCLVSAPPISAQAGIKERRTPIVTAIEKVRPSVVSISSEKKAGSNARWPFSNEESQQSRVNGMGSGVIVDARGYILTNQHVVDRVQSIEVQLHDGTTYPARVLSADSVMDLAVLKIDAGRPLIPIAIGSSADLMVGETVITIGNAFGYENTTSSGIISYIGRNVTLSDDQVYRNLIQTDACINPGNSGGPMINIDGELIGINVAVRAGAQGIGFALPIDDVKRVAVDMMSTRRLAATWHGLVADEVFRNEQRQVVLREVQTGSPAESAGLQRGDQIVKVGELPVATPLDIERGFLDLPAGTASPVTVLREGKEQVVNLQLASLARSGGNDITDQLWRSLGVRVVPVSRDYVAAVSPEFRGGLYVQAVLPGSPASRASLEKGDILVGMNSGQRKWETIRPDHVLYVLRQPDVQRNGTLQVYFVRRNEFVQGILPIREERLGANRN
jgi:serine protease Do